MCEKKKVLPERALRHCSRLPRECVELPLESPSLEISKTPWTMPEKDAVVLEFDPALGTVLD